MKLLLTNDDGIDAPGIEALAQAVAELGTSIILAPEEHQSGCGHQTTVLRPLTCRSIDSTRHALDGTPVDCVRVGLTHLAPDTDWVVSGINAGGNLGADVYQSGTVAAAREALLLGRHGVAVSQYRKSREPFDWQWAARVTARLLKELFAEHTEPRFFNVNLPDVPEVEWPEVVHCPLDPNPLPVYFESRDGRLHYRARYQDRPRHEGCDVDRCFAGAVTITDLTDLTIGHAR